MFIGRGLAYHKTEEMDLNGRNRGPIDWEGCGVPQNRGNELVLEKSYFLLSFIFKMKYFSGERIIKTKILVLLFDENQI